MAKGHAVSRGMFRETGEHVAPELLHTLAAESLCLMLLL